MKKIDSGTAKSELGDITITEFDTQEFKQSLLPKSFFFDNREDKELYLSIVGILTSDNETSKQLELLRDCALRFNIDLDFGRLDDDLSISFFHEQGEFMEFFGMNESDLCDDMNDMLELGVEAFDGVDVCNDIIFNLSNEDVVHIHGGIYSGGFTIYQFDTLVKSISLKRQSENFRNTLSELGITQKHFARLVGVSVQCVSKWQRTKFPQWVNLALMGIKVLFDDQDNQNNQNNQTL